MKARTAIRKTVKWGGAVTVVLLVAVWVASGWWNVWWSYPAWAVMGFRQGIFGVEVYKPGRAPRVRVGSFACEYYPPMQFRWAFDIADLGSCTYCLIPLWMPTLVVLLPTGSAWWLDRRAALRARPTLCPTCGYDRRGLAPDAVCPECGAAATPAIIS